KSRPRTMARVPCGPGQIPELRGRERGRRAGEGRRDRVAHAQEVRPPAGPRRARPVKLRSPTATAVPATDPRPLVKAAQGMVAGGTVWSEDAGWFGLTGLTAPQVLSGR